MVPRALRKADRFEGEPALRICLGSQPPPKSPKPVYRPSPKSKEYWEMAAVAEQAARLISLDSHRQVLMDEVAYWRDRAQRAEQEERSAPELYGNSPLRICR